MTKIRVVSWNIAKRSDPWRELDRMAQHDEADVALLQEAGSPPGDLRHLTSHDDEIFWDRSLYDRWPVVVQLSDRVKVERFRQVPPTSEHGKMDIGASGIGTMAAARIIPNGRPEDTVIAVSMYARWLKPHPSTNSTWRTGTPDGSAQRILSDISAFIGHEDPTTHRILAAGDLNIIYSTDYNAALHQGKYGRYWFNREWTVWQRFDALGLEFLGPQLPNGRPAAVPCPTDTLNVPTYKTSREKTPADSWRQLDYAFASRGFHKQVSVRAVNGLDEWGPSDHCRLLIEIGNKETAQ